MTSARELAPNTSAATEKEPLPLRPSELLSKAADLIEPEGAWGQGMRRRSGPRCAVDALAEVTPRGQSWLDLIDFVYLAIGSGEVGPALSEWNDDPERTQAEVVAALRAAAELARGEGQ